MTDVAFRPQRIPGSRFKDSQGDQILRGWLILQALQKHPAPSTYIFGPEDYAFYDGATGAYTALNLVSFADHARSRALAALKQLEALQPNWDGYGARSPRKDLLAVARDLLRKFPSDLPSLQVTPLSSGTVQIEIHEGERSLEIEVESDKSLHYLKWDPQAGIEDEASFPVSDVQRLSGLIDWFIR